MSTKKLQEKVQELVSLREMAAELADEIEALTDEIKADMDRQGVDTLEAGKHTVGWAVVKSCRFDSKAFKTAYPYQTFGKDLFNLSLASFWYGFEKGRRCERARQKQKERVAYPVTDAGAEYLKGVGE